MFEKIERVGVNIALETQHMRCDDEGVENRPALTLMTFTTSCSANAWTVHEEHVSLVRATPQSRVLKVAAQPAQVEIDLTRSALIVVDMQNDFCHPEGWFGCAGKFSERVRQPIPVIASLSDQLRAAGARIVWLNWGIREDRANLPPGVLYRGKRRATESGYGETPSNGRGPAVVQGTWGATLIEELSPAPQDLLVYKHRLSGFWDSELDSILRQAGITTLLFAGVNIDRCVFSTLQDAGFLGYDCLLIEDACATPSPPFVSDAILFLVRELHGFTLNSLDLTASLSSLNFQELP